MNKIVRFLELELVTIFGSVGEIEMIQALVHRVIFHAEINVVFVLVVKIRNFKRHLRNGVALGIYGNDVLCHEIKRIALYIARQQRRNVLIVVNVYVEIYAVFRFFVFGVRLKTYGIRFYTRRFIVDVERKLKRILIGFAVVFIPIERALHFEYVFSVIRQAPFVRVHFDGYRRTDVSAAVCVCLTYIMLCLVVNKLARNRVGYRNVHCLCAAQKPAVYHVQLIYGPAITVIVHGDRGFIAARENLHFIFVLFIEVTAERHDILTVVIQAKRRRLARGCLRFFGFLYRLIGIGHGKLVYGIIEQRSVGPIAVEREERNGQVGKLRILVFEHEVTFHVHAVFKAFVEIFFIARRKRNGNFHFRRLARGNRNGRYGRSVYFICSVGRREHVCVFFDGALVYRKRFRKYVSGKIVACLNVRIVYYRKLGIVHA